MYDPAKKAERCAVLSSCCGVTGEAALTDSAVILLFAASLGSGISRLISSLFLRQADDVGKGFFLIFPATAVVALFFLLKSRKAADKKT